MVHLELLKFPKKYASTFTFVQKKLSKNSSIYRSQRVEVKLAFLLLYMVIDQFFSWLKQSQIHSFTQMVAISCRQPKSPIKSLQFVAGWWGSWSKGQSVVVRCWKFSVQTLLGCPCRTRNPWSKKSIARTAIWLTPKNFHFESYQSGPVWRTGHRAGLGWLHLGIKCSLQCWYLSYLSD